MTAHTVEVLAFLTKALLFEGFDFVLTVPRSLRHQAKCLWVVEIYIFHFTLQPNISSWQKGPDFSAVQLNGRPSPPMYRRLVTMYYFLLDVKYR